ncbi:DNA mismatch repair protein [Wickerhamomyces ciferrii]|uniref:DNA mismatch repair protein n=1 Tax=Wickerhamomyces ciferrii (strain ATCC 14091 / BCRC 22168 / CBS 111 / JCM 3599 / NBRC 0793 / NRRL Y-1031 F-60-10) TaxID=1206466 RepID=K0K9L3_WICCF|nr:DNA mismatch repair protein [Wickerhamomyces ciferrii]CCH41605.1 DNA mismatch repair protein [Wickerhamomyces ciferrii]
MPLKHIDLKSIHSITSCANIFSPVSVIKELIENSIDSNATSIIITLDSMTCGLKYINIIDNGQGIPKEDRHLICQNHTTSKISDISDIQGISTLGFRGEALFFINQLTCQNNIGSMEFITRSTGDTIGSQWKIGMNGDIIGNPKPIAMNKGTQLTIKNIFKSTPVRYKILSKLKSQNIESLQKLIFNYSIIHPHIRFQLKFINNHNKITQNIIYNSNTPNITKFIQKLNIPQKIPQLFEFQNQSIDQDWSFNTILPIMDTSSHLITSKNMIIISINKRILNHNQYNSTGWKLWKLIKSLYSELNLFKPGVWVLELETNKRHLIDVNVEPEKNDVLIHGLEGLIEGLREKLIGLVREIHGINRIDEINNKTKNNNYNNNTSNNNKIEDEVEEVEIEDNDEEIEISRVHNKNIDLYDSDDLELEDQLNKEIDNDKQYKEKEVEEIEVDDDEDLELEQDQNLRLKPKIDDKDIEPISNSNDLINTSNQQTTSSQDIDWSTNMYDKLSSRSSTLDQQPIMELIDEDFNISKNLNISNPFTLMNLQKKGNNSNYLITPDNSVEKIDNDDIEVNEVDKINNKDEIIEVNEVNKTNTSKSKNTKLPIQSRLSTKPQTIKQNKFHKPNKIHKIHPNRLLLQNYEYLQSYKLKFPIPSQITAIQNEEIIKPLEINNSLISQNLFDYYNSLSNVELKKFDNLDWFYIGSKGK